MSTVALPNRTIEMRISLIKNHDDVHLDRHISVHIHNVEAVFAAAEEKLGASPLAQLFANAQDQLFNLFSIYNDCARIEIGQKEPLKATAFNPVDGKIVEKELDLFPIAAPELPLPPQPVQVEAQPAILDLKEHLRSLLREIAEEDKAKASS
jgi:hypothetical protein